MKRGGFLSDRRGATAVAFALAIPVVIGAAAFAVDMSYYNVVRNQLQSAADAAALAGAARVDDPDAAVAMALQVAAANTPGNFGDIVEAADIAVGIFDPASKSFVGTLDSPNAVKVVASRNAAHDNPVPRYLSAIWGGDTVAIDAMAIAARSVEITYTEPPTVTQLEPEAGDYNQVYVYCFDYEGEGSKEDRRSQMTLIADNEGTAYEYDWPTCGEGQSLSFRLRNVRHVRAYPYLWDEPNRWPGRPEFDYYTDTTIAEGIETFDLGVTILETVLCDSLAGCVGASQGGVIPEGRNRDPVLANAACEPGKYMYYGWEDRPPGQAGASATWTDPAWTDRDFDDIRIVMKCPVTGKLGDRLVRLVR